MIEARTTDGHRTMKIGRELARQCYHWRRMRLAADTLLESLEEARPPVARYTRPVLQVVRHLETAAELRLYRFLREHGEPIRFRYYDGSRHRVRIDPMTNDHEFTPILPRLRRP